MAIFNCKLLTQPERTQFQPFGEVQKPEKPLHDWMCHIQTKKMDREICVAAVPVDAATLFTLEILTPLQSAQQSSDSET